MMYSTRKPFFVCTAVLLLNVANHVWASDPVQSIEVRPNMLLSGPSGGGLQHSDPPGTAKKKSQDGEGKEDAQTKKTA